MASLNEMLKAGYKPAQSSTEQIFGLLKTAQDQAQANDKKNQQDTADQTKLFIQLREAGYSTEEAATKVNRTYRSTDFIENLVNGGKAKNPLNQPSGEDKVTLDTRKTKADIGKAEADTALAKSKANYYDAGGPKRTVIDKMTPNQLQSRIKYLESIKGTMDTPEDNQNIEDELKFINDKLQTVSGFKPGEIPEAAREADPAKVMTSKVVMTGPDGKKYKIPAANVAKAKARGFK